MRAPPLRADASSAVARLPERLGAGAGLGAGSCPRRCQCRVPEERASPTTHPLSWQHLEPRSSPSCLPAQDGLAPPCPPPPLVKWSSSIFSSLERTCRPPARLLSTQKEKKCSLWSSNKNVIYLQLAVSTVTSEPNTLGTRADRGVWLPPRPARQALLRAAGSHDLERLRFQHTGTTLSQFSSLKS